jgi:hypothetical protein
MHRAALMIVLAISSLGLWAQSGETQSGPPPTTPPRTFSPPLQILVTGCLKRGPDGGFYLSDRNGVKWDLSSKTVDFCEHVMHVVTVTGKPGTMSPSQPSNQSSGNGETSGNASHPLQVLTLKMVSNSCTR